MHLLNLSCQWLSPLFTIYTYTSILLQWARIQTNHCFTTCKSLTKASKTWPWESKMWGLLAQKTSFQVLFFYISTLYPPLRKKLPNVLYGGRIEALFADLSIYCIVLHSHHVARVQILASTPYEGWVCFWFSSLLQEDFLGFFVFSFSSKTNTSKFLSTWNARAHWNELSASWVKKL